MECHSSQTFDNRQPEKPYDKYLEILCVKTFFVCHDESWQTTVKEGKSETLEKLHASSEKAAGSIDNFG